MRKNQRRWTELLGKYKFVVSNQTDFNLVDRTFRRLQHILKENHISGLLQARGRPVVVLKRIRMDPPKIEGEHHD